MSRSSSGTRRSYAPTPAGGKPTHSGKRSVTSWRLKRDNTGQMPMRPEGVGDWNWDVRSRAPLRLGLAGGGTDLAAYFDHFGGLVLNATIDRYAYAHLLRRSDGNIVFKADDLGREESLPCDLDFDAKAGLSLHRAVYRHMIMHFNDG